MNIRILISVVLVFMFILIGKIYYDTYTIEISHYQITNSRLSHALAGKKIAFISDLHSKTFESREIKVISILEREKPDIIFVGGDYISFDGPYEPALLFLNQLRNAYAIMGNTDYYNENGSCVLCHEERSQKLRGERNIYFLRNSALSLGSGSKRFNLVGVDDPVNKRDDIREAIRKIDVTAPTILLAHSPQVFEDAVKNGIDFVLCGHNHGGQVFIARYLKGAILVDPCFDYMEGFFQKGQTLMYVGSGIGNSFLPFRLGVRPEVAFFEFAGETDKSTNSSVSNIPIEISFTGFSVKSLMTLFDFLNLLNKPYRTKHRVSPSGKLFDFETEAELEYLNWECHKWFEFSDKNATSGKNSLQVTLPPGQYPGIKFIDIEKNWSSYRQLNMNVFNPSSEPFTFHVRIDDKKSRWEYEDRYDRDFKVQKGMNHISIPLESVKANITPRALDLSHIERLMLFIPGNDRKRTFYLDNIRLE